MAAGYNSVGQPSWHILFPAATAVCALCREVPVLPPNQRTATKDRRSGRAKPCRLLSCCCRRPHGDLTHETVFLLSLALIPLALLVPHAAAATLCVACNGAPSCYAHIADAVAAAASVTSSRSARALHRVHHHHQAALAHHRQRHPGCFRIQARFLCRRARRQWPRRHRPGQRQHLRLHRAQRHV